MKRKALPTDAEIEGQAATPQFRLVDINDQGRFARDNLGHFIRDIMLKASATYGAMGGAYALTTGLSIDIYPPLSIYRQADGREFSFYSDTQATLTLDAADPDRTRIDLVVAALHEDTASNTNLRYFRQSPPNPGNPEGQINAADEIWDYVTIEVVKGEAAVSPTAPELPINTVLLYTITLPAAAAALDNIFIADGRISVQDQQTQDEEIAALMAEVDRLKGFAPPYKARDVNIDTGAGRFSGLTEQDAWAIIGNQSDATQYDPLTRPQTITADGKLGAVGTQESTLPVVDMPVGLSVAFSNGIRPITVDTLPASLNPRQINKSSGSGTESDKKDTSPLTLSNLLTIESDGGGSWLQRSALCPTGRVAPACAARDGRYIESFGGYTPAGGQLSDWFTYDSVSDTVTPRTISGNIPPGSSRPAMFTCGDDTHVLLACPQSGGQVVGETFLANHAPGVTLSLGQSLTFDLGIFNPPQQNFSFTVGQLVSFEVTTGEARGRATVTANTGTTLTVSVSSIIGTGTSTGQDWLIGISITNPATTSRWFLVNAVTAVSVELFGGPTQTADNQPYVAFIGDMVQPGKIVFGAQAPNPNSNATWRVRSWWQFDVGSSTFSQLTISGMGPTGPVMSSDICFYASGQLIIVEFDAALQASGRTFLFSYGTLSWTQLNIAQPSNVFSSSQAPLSQFRLVNIGGKPTLWGGTNENSGGQTAFWQLTPGSNPAWQSFTPSGLPRLWLPGGASLLVNGTPSGGGYSFAGLNPASQQGTRTIFVFSQGGVIETVYGGVTGLTLAPGTRQATISLPAYQVALSGTVAKALLSLDGFLPAGSIAISISLDGGTSYQSVNRETVTSVLASSSPGQRRIRITMYGGGSPPIITGVHETYSKTGSSDGLTMLYIRFDCPSSTKGLYIKRDGTMEVLSSVVPTTPDEAVLIQTVHNGNGNDPSVKNFINQRVMIIEYAGVKGGSDPQFAYEGAVAPRLITPEATTGGATGALYRIAAPTIAFNGTVTVTGLATSSDYYHIRIFA